MVLRNATGSNMVPMGDDRGNAYVASAPRSYATSTIPSGASQPASGINLKAGTLARIGLPADIGTATTMTFQVSVDGVTWRDLYDTDGTELKLAGGATLAAGKSYLMELSKMCAVQYVKPRFGTSAAPNTHTSDRTIDLTILA